MSTLSAHFTLPLYLTIGPRNRPWPSTNYSTDLAETIWNRYEIPLIELLTCELDQYDASQYDLFDFDDPINF